jgi:AraC-like DNA-binding protein
VLDHGRHAPPPDLAPFVEHFWTVGWDLRDRPPHVAETLPHPSVHIVFQQGASRVAGVCRSRFTVTLEGQGRVFGIKFLPGGFYPFVEWPVSRITDRVVPIPDVFGEGSADIEELLLDAEGIDARMAIATDFLRRRLPQPDASAAEAGRLVARILTDPEIQKVEDLAFRSGASPRQLQRMFSRTIGVSPKWVIQRYRLHEALARIEAGGTPDWPQLALDLGYTDQAHFIRAFKALVGRTPGEYARDLAPSS